MFKRALTLSIKYIFIINIHVFIVITTIISISIVGYSYYSSPVIDVLFVIDLNVLG